MKKILYSVLSVVMCLSLCACQGSPDRYPEIADMLDRGDYEGAIDKIRDMGGIVESSKDTSSTQNDVSLSETVSSKEETSSVASTEESSEEPSSSVETSSASTVKHGKVTITLDNWDEYFEFVAVENWEENAFGETERLTFLYYFQPKEEYTDKIKKNVNFNLAVEYTCSTTSGLNPIPAAVNYENRTYSLGDFPSDTMKLKRDFRYTGIPESVGEFARVLGDGMLHEYCWDFDVTRIEGAIYLK